MATQLQLRRGTTTQNNNFTGAVGELSIDTTLKQVRVHDGSTAGGTAVPGTGLSFGVAGNTAPATNTLSVGTPANVVIRSATGQSGNVIIGDATATSSFSLDVRGTANVGVFTSGAITSTGVVTGTGFTAGSAVLAEAELELLDGLTPGTAIASKVVTTDSDADTTGQRNLTISGELDAATLDISGNADIDGILEADAMTLNGTAITTTATLDTGISNNNVPKFTTGVADDDFLRVAGTAVEGRSAAEVLSDIAAAPAAGSSNIVTTGALNAGSITSGFTSIDVGAGAISTTGVGSFGSLDISGNIDIDGITNLDVVDIDGAVDMASTLQVDGAITGSSTIVGTTITATTAFVPDAQDGAALGTTSLQFSDLFLADAAVLGFGDDNDVTLTHVPDTGLLLNAAMAIQFRDAAISIGSTADGDLSIAADDEIDLTSTLIDVNGKLEVSGNIVGASAITDGAGGGMVPPGTIVSYSGATAPTGYVLCNDAALSRTSFSVLFAIISTAFGAGDGTTTFNVPDLRDRLPLGKGTNNGTLGAITAAAAASAVVATASGSAALTKTTTTFATSAKDSSTATALTNVTAGGHTHNLTLPAQVVNYIIKT